MIEIKKPNNSTIAITIKSEDGICPFCNGTGWMKVSNRTFEFRKEKYPVKISVVCEWCNGTGKRS